MKLMFTLFMSAYINLQTIITCITSEFINFQKKKSFRSSAICFRLFRLYLHTPLHSHTKHNISFLCLLLADLFSCLILPSGMSVPITILLRQNFPDAISPLLGRTCHISSHPSSLPLLHSTPSLRLSLSVFMSPFHLCFYLYIYCGSSPLLAHSSSFSFPLSSILFIFLLHSLRPSFLSLQPSVRPSIPHNS